MSLIGKFFVVMQILLSVTFMGFAATVFTYQTNFKQEADQLEKDKIKIQGEMQQLQEDYDNYKIAATNDLMQANERADRAESANTALQREVTALQDDNKRVQNELASQIALTEVAQDEAESRRAEAMAQRKVNVELLDKLRKNIADGREVADELYNVTVAKENLEKKNQSLAKNVGFLEKVVRNNDLETDPRIVNAQNEPPPVVEGLVKATATNDRGSVDMVEISIGSDDGLVKGHVLSVYRSGLQDGQDAQYLGEIELVFVESDSAVGTVKEKAKNGIIQKGDNVTSKL